ncbi:hypothetical protein BJ741DRAFT_172690 [Chytriomyces cf. hyalinus JEL632]|nr:hypothetical protein BJ741DRAFT_172690 [Chytriomyces cf. hyalinus JEL632]
MSETRRQGFQANIVWGASLVMIYLLSHICKSVPTVGMIHMTQVRVSASTEKRSNSFPSHTNHGITAYSKTHSPSPHLRITSHA